MATYAYFIDNTYNPAPADHTKIFRYIKDIQLDEDNVFAENYGEQEAFKILLGRIEGGDILVIRSFADLGHSLSKILKVLSVLAEYEIDIISIEEDYYNADTYRNLISDLCKISVDLQERVRISGYQIAKEKGKIGRPKNTGIKEALDLYYTRRFTVEQICKMASISQSTLYRAIRDRQAKIKGD